MFRQTLDHVLTSYAELVWTSDLPATRKRALSRATDTAAQLGKQKKIKGGSGQFLISDTNSHPITRTSPNSVIASMDKQPPDNPKDGMVQTVPPRFARSTLMPCLEF